MITFSSASNSCPPNMPLTVGAKRNWRDSYSTLLLSFFLAIMALAFVGISERSLLSTFIIYFICGTFGTIMLVVENIAGRMSTARIREFWVTFGLRIFIVAILHIALSQTIFAPWWNYGSSGGDEVNFWLFSERLVQVWQNMSILQENPLQYENYFAWLQIVGFTRFLSSLFGADSVFNVRLVLCMAGALIVPYVYAMALRLFDERVATLAGALAFWLPDYWYYSATILRDVFISCVMVIIYYQIIEIVYGRFRWWRVVLAVLLNFLAIRYLRTAVAYVNVFIIGLCLALRDFTRLKNFVYRIIIAGLIIGCILIIVKLTMPNAFSQRILIDNAVDVYKNRLVKYGIAGASKDSFGLAVLRAPVYIQWPLSTIIVLLQPIPPWIAFFGGKNLFPLKAIVLTICSFVWFGLMTFLPVGLFCCIKKKLKKSVWVLIPFITLTILLGYSVAAQPRWRLMFMPFLLIIISVGILNSKQHRFLHLATILFIAFALIVYSVLKYMR